MEGTARKPWWKKKRSLVALGIVWLIFAYMGGVGPVGYALGRGWISLSSAELYVAPFEALDDVPGLRTAMDLLSHYAQWWRELGQEHAV